MSYIPSKKIQEKSGETSQTENFSENFSQPKKKNKIKSIFNFIKKVVIFFTKK
jgi:hypothetical protein